MSRTKKPAVAADSSAATPTELTATAPAKKRTPTKKAAAPVEAPVVAKPTSAPKQNVIRFRLTRNHLVAALAPYLTNGLAPSPPASMKNDGEAWVRDLTNPHGGKVLKRQTNQFDLSHVFTIVLPATEPREVKNKPGMPEAFRLALQQKEYERALAAQDKSERLRSILKHFASPRGLAAIEIVDDPSDFLEQDAFYSEAELKDKLAEDNRATAARLSEKAERDHRALAALKVSK